MKPLQGIRVLDFTWVGAGPFATKVLSDFGAEVVKIESRTRPDQLRQAEPLSGTRSIEESGYFANRNVGKKSVSIDLKQPDARSLVLALARQSDVVINSFSYGVMERFGLTYDVFRTVREDIIYVSMPFGGHRGPYRDFLGYGMNIAALVGAMALGGRSDRWPVGTGTNFPDHIPNPLHAAFGILAALTERQRSGKGQEVILSQLDSTLAMFPDDLLDYSANGRTNAPDHAGEPDAGPHGLYPCKGQDRWCAISARGNDEFAKLAEAIGRSDLRDDPRFRTAPDRQANSAALSEVIAGWTLVLDAHDVMARLQAAGIAAGVVQTSEDLLTRDPQLRARGFWQYLDHPVMGRSVYHGIPAVVSTLSNRYSSPAPLLGQHNDELCALTGLPLESLAELERKGVLQ